MKKSALVFTLWFVAQFNLVAQAINPADLDALNDKEDFKTAINLIEKQLPALAGPERASALTLLAREYVFYGSQRRDAGAKPEELLPIFEKGEGLATQALALDSSNYLTYYWRSANSGRWGQIKGVLDSLFRAEGMKNDLSQTVRLRDDHPDSWHVLGLLYEALPGFPVSFGNTDYSVSLGRKSVDLMRDQFQKGQRKHFNAEFLFDLSEHLWARNWDAGQRFREQQTKQANLRNAKDNLEKGFYYEGTIAIYNMSDRQEAKALADEAIAYLKALPKPDFSQRTDLATFQKIVARR